MKVSVDTGRCMGHALCNAMSPNVYTVTDEGYNEMGEFELPEEFRDTALRGARACPEKVITVADEV